VSFLADDGTVVESRAVAKGLRLPTEQIKKQAIASKDKHAMSINSLDAEGIARYLTHDNPNDMVDAKRMREIKRACKENPRLKKSYKIAIRNLVDANDIDRSEDIDTTSNVFDGMAI